jgi:hypothetical protein
MGAKPGLAALAVTAAWLAACGWPATRESAVGETPLRIEQAVSDASNPVERGGERSVPGSGQLLDQRRMGSQ